MSALEQLRLSVPLTKIDVERRLVIGRAAAEERDKAGEIMDYSTAKPMFKAWSDEALAATSNVPGMEPSRGNVRAMHQKTAVGKLTDIAFDDDARAIEVVAKIVDPIEWQKVTSGCYTGFSVGGGYAKKWTDPATGCTRYTPRPSEISLVDNPCMPSARFVELVKADGMSAGTLELRGRAPLSFSAALAGRAASFNDVMNARPLSFGDALAKRVNDSPELEKAIIPAVLGGYVGSKIGRYVGRRLGAESVWRSKAPMTPFERAMRIDHAMRTGGRRGTYAGAAVGALGAGLAAHAAFSPRKQKEPKPSGAGTCPTCGAPAPTMQKNYIGVLASAANPFDSVEGYVQRHAAATRARHAALRAKQTASTAPKPSGAGICPTCGAPMSAPMAKAWDGSKHARNDDGQFATTGGEHIGGGALGVAGAIAGGLAAMRYGHRVAFPLGAFAGKAASRLSRGTLSKPIHPSDIRKEKRNIEIGRIFAASAAAPAGIEAGRQIGKAINKWRHNRAAKKVDGTPMAKAWDGSKHLRHHDGKFATKTGERIATGVVGTAGAIAGGLAALRYGPRAAGAVGALAGKAVSRFNRGTLRAPVHLTDIRAEQSNMKRGKFIGTAAGEAYRPTLFGAGIAAGAALGGTAGGNIGHAIDKWRHGRTAKKAGKLDQFKRLNAGHSVAPKNMAQARTMARKIKPFADAVAG
jgi:hypothetical protein